MVRVKTVESERVRIRNSADMGSGFVSREYSIFVVESLRAKVAKKMFLAKMVAAPRWCTLVIPLTPLRGKKESGFDS